MSSAEFVLPCADLEPTIEWFEGIGFRLRMISPADAPSVAVLDGHGASIRLDTALPDGPTALRLPAAADDARVVIAPNGTMVEFVADTDELVVPPNDPAFVIDRFADADFGSGRAGMQYRDLVPNRHGGRYVASHINIPVGGPVPDYVHHHHIRFQMIFCHAGWADLVYEDQGPPFRFSAGDCVLQPPHIRHQVLATSDAFEVVEISSPAVHDTLRDHELALPTGVVDPGRNFGGQTFVWHQTAGASAESWRFEGFSFERFGIDAATDGLASVGTVRTDGASTGGFTPGDEFTLWFVRTGEATLRRNGESLLVGPRDSITLHPAEHYELDAPSHFEFLEVRVPEPTQTHGL